MDYDSLDDVLDKIHSCKVKFDSEKLRNFLIKTAEETEDTEYFAMKNAIDVYSKTLLSYYLYDKPQELVLDYTNKKVFVKRLD